MRGLKLLTLFLLNTLVLVAPLAGAWIETNSPDWLTQVLNTGRADDGSINNKAASRGAGFTNTEQAQMYANYMATQEERQWNESMYQKYQSYSGQVQQMQEAGLNPAMMYGGSPSAGSVFQFQ